MKQPTMSSEARREILAATRDSLPIWIGVSPFGLVFGLLGQQTELGVPGTLAMSSFVFAGSAQFISLGLLQAGTAYPLIILTTLVVNLRHMLYGASLAPYIQRLRPAWQRLLAFGLTDESYALTVTRFTRSDPHHSGQWYFLAANANMFVCWQLSTALGILLGAWVPDPAALGLDFALSATLIGLIIPHVRDRAAVVTMVVAGVVALLARDLPGRLGLLLAPLLAATAGLAWERVAEGRTHRVSASGQAQGLPLPNLSRDAKHSGHAEGLPVQDHTPDPSRSGRAQDPPLQEQTAPEAEHEEAEA